MLNGVLFKVHYSGISNDFYVEAEAGKHFIHIRVELDLDHATSLRQLRLNAWIPRGGGGKHGQCILCCELPELEKVDIAALKRTGSNEGYCEPIKALRNSGRLIITTIPTG
jgi:hypothetical protein